MSDSYYPVINADESPLGALVQLAEADPNAREAIKRVALMTLAHRAISELVFEIPAIDGVGGPLDPKSLHVLDGGRVLTIVEALPADIQEAIRRSVDELRALAREHNAQLPRWYEVVAELRHTFAHLSLRPEYPLVMKLYTEAMAAVKASEDSGNPFPILSTMLEQGIDVPGELPDELVNELSNKLSGDRVDDEPLDKSALRETLRALAAMLPEVDDDSPADDEPERLPPSPGQDDCHAGTDDSMPAQRVDETVAARCRRTIRRYQLAVGGLCAAAMVILVVTGLMTHAAQERARDAEKQADVRIADVESEAKRAVEQARAVLDVPVIVEVEKIGQAPFHWLGDLPGTVTFGDTKITVSREADQ